MMNLRRCYASYNVKNVYEVLMPALSPSMEEGKILEWKVNVGDKVAMGQVLASIETDKANMDFESPEDGIIAKIIVPVGGVALCNSVIGLMVSKEEDVQKLKVVEDAPAPSKAEAPKVESAPAPSSAPKAVKPKANIPKVPFSVLELPALSPNMTEGKIVNWLKKPGDEINTGEGICEIETDKAVMTYESDSDGFLASILVEPGVVTPLNAPIGIVVTKKEDISAVKDYRPLAEQSQSEPEPEAVPETQSSPQTTQATHSSAPKGGRVFASPLARKLAEEKGYNINEITGTGPEGRVIAADIKEFVPTPKAKTEKAPAQKATVSAPGVYPEFTDTDVTSVRKVIAKKLTECKQTVPHYYLTIECRVDELMNLRETLNNMGEGKYKLSFNDFVLKASSLAMRAVPVVNAEWRGDVIRQYKDVNISVAVSTDKGLVTPVVRNVNKKSLSEISSGVKNLASKSRENKLALTDLEGGTFTVSNLGMYGVTQFAAVINPPQACILAVGAPTKKLALDGEKVVEHTMTNFTLSCDHRVVDGAVGAEWLKEFKKIVENPLSLLV